MNKGETPDIFRGMGIEIEPVDRPSFLKIKETLTRLGVASKNGHTLFQSCHILQKRGRYAIMHFKEMFALDGKPSTFDEEDEARRNTIAILLEDFKLLKIKDDIRSRIEENCVALKGKIKVLKFEEKRDWQLVQMHSLGKPKR